MKFKTTPSWSRSSTVLIDSSLVRENRGTTSVFRSNKRNFFFQLQPRIGVSVCALLLCSSDTKQTENCEAEYEHGSTLQFDFGSVYCSLLPFKLFYWDMDTDVSVVFCAKSLHKNSQARGKIFNCLIIQARNYPFCAQPSAGI